MVRNTSHCVANRAAEGRSAHRRRAGRSSAPARVDAVDKGIIEALQANGREPFRRIAATLGVSEATIRARYAKLVEDEILQVTGVTNPLGLGFEAQAMVGVRTAGAARRASRTRSPSGRRRRTSSSSRASSTCSSSSSAADRRALLDVTNRIRALADVISTESFLYLELMKQSYDWGAREHDGRHGGGA